MTMTSSRKEEAATASRKEEAATQAIPVISDRETLLKYGIVKVPIPSSISRNEQSKWASELSRVTPMIMFGQGDDEYPFYRNILEEEPELGFPLANILTEQVQEALATHFQITSTDELRLDDAFCVHYNPSQSVTSGAKHMDPSDITVNLCLEKTDTVEGSHVLFHGTKKLAGDDNPGNEEQPNQFLVSQEQGYATIHYGSHPHETTPLLKGGKRTNIILTYCYVDKSKSDVAKRNCFFD